MLESIKEALKKIVQAPFVWAALLPLLTKLWFIAFPAYPADLWDSIITFISAVLVVLGVAVGTAAGIQRYRFIRALRGIDTA